MEVIGDHIMEAHSSIGLVRLCMVRVMFLSVCQHGRREYHELVYYFRSFGCCVVVGLGSRARSNVFSPSFPSETTPSVLSRISFYYIHF